MAMSWFRRSSSFISRRCRPTWRVCIEFHTYALVGMYASGTVPAIAAAVTPVAASCAPPGPRAPRFSAVRSPKPLPIADPVTEPGAPTDAVGARLTLRAPAAEPG
eukprot:CAMPEP_0205904076 /NCGR_PEP_ID=MMETSP1325-20131115/500_1 /ASSEMBLY_ACC=CAM_ASM_000708 /TAXON_ID=236786 /ORGANISM="Florenciella sp., Strain RCC1007" /LENGTH=104 /DNA_ID=CAMNT_0053269799 /DNA_START=91 /DNA_END=401 /DNA_ORIENTATION=+